MFNSLGHITKPGTYVYVFFPAQQLYSGIKLFIEKTCEKVSVPRTFLRSRKLKGRERACLAVARGLDGYLIIALYLCC